MTINDFITTFMAVYRRYRRHTTKAHPRQSAGVELPKEFTIRSWRDEEAFPNKLADNVTDDYWLLQEGSKYPDLTAYDYFYGDTLKVKFILQ